MPIISVVSPKGGAGKTTLSNVLATTYCSGGASVAIMDCDPQENQKTWKDGPPTDPGVKTNCEIDVVNEITSDNIFSHQKRLRSEKSFVLIDTPGRKDLIMSRAIMRADLVLIPVQPSPNDIAGAIEAIKIVRIEADGNDRHINFACVMVNTPGSDSFKTKIHKDFEAFTKDANVTLLQTQLRSREAYRQIFLERVAVHELDPKRVNSLPKAISNAEELAGEVFQLLQQVRAAA